ncbi:MAG: hypothetical protein R3C99_17695 [Pirellulaceae bacterium]
MSNPARVTSIDAVHRFRISLREYSEQIRDVTLALNMELRRVLEWIDHERPAYWRASYERASLELVEKRNELERCMNNTVGDERRSCFAERKAFERTKRRLETAERKMRVVRQWQYQLRQEMDKLQSQIAKLDFMLDDDVAKGLAVLERMTSALDDYAG